MKISNLIVFFVVILIILIGVSVVVSSSSDDSNPINSLGHDNISVVVTGDVFFGRNMPNVLDSGESPFRYVENVTKSANILLVNFENPVTTSTNQVKQDVPLKADPKYTNLLSSANSKVVASQDNNHVLDFGIEGMKDSLNNLKTNGIISIGAGNNIDEASQPAVVNVGDRIVTILNYMDSDNFAEYADVLPKAGENNAGYCAYDSALAKKQIEAAKKNSSCVIVYIHYGNEYSRSPNPTQEKISHECIDYGADMVAGSHTHVTQGIEMYKGKPIFYNLGNFIFDQSNPNTHRAYFLNLNLVDGDGKVTIYPISIENYLPHFMNSTDGKLLLNELNPHCDDVVVNDDGTGSLTFKLGNVTNNK